MTCRHSANDPSCSSHKDYRDPYESYSSVPKTPDAKNYTIVDAVAVGRHLVIKVSYPNCKTCSYEGVKVLVYLGVSSLNAMRWRTIDPHFRDPKKASRDATEAPGPSARFPASEEGWADALAYAQVKVQL